MIVSTEAIVLHSRKYSDTSSILSLYTREHGKIGVVVKGARRPKSKFGSNVMPLSIIDASYYYKAGRDLHTLSNAESAVQLRQLINSYEHLSLALAVAETVNVTQPQAEKNASLYELLRSTLIMLNESNENVYAFFAFFCIHLAELMGFMIDFTVEEDSESESKKLQSNELYFSFENGAPYQAHEVSAFYAFRLRRSTLRHLHAIASMSISTVHTVVLDEETQREMQQFFVSYFSHHLERRIVFRAERIVLGDM